LEKPRFFRSHFPALIHTVLSSSDSDLFILMLRVASIKHGDVSPTHRTPITPWQFAQRRVGSRPADTSRGSNSDEPSW